MSKNIGAKDRTLQRIVMGDKFVSSWWRISNSGSVQKNCDI